MEYENLLENKSKLENQLSDSIKNLYDLIGKIRESEIAENNKEELIKSIEDLLPASWTRQTIVPDIIKNEIGISQIAQQVDLIQLKSRVRSQSLYNICPAGNDKVLDQKFAKIFDVPCPAVYQQGVSIDELELKPGSIIKPLNGSSSRGVCYIFDSDKIQYVKTGETYSSLQQLPETIRSIKGPWQSEQLIQDEDGGPANDFKVYSYYGQIGAILEIKRTKPKISYFWYYPDGTPIEQQVGHKSNPGIGKGFSTDLITYAKKISIATPSPFLRIDFFKGKDDFYLGEITPHPGRYSGGYSPVIDKYLGNFFLDARARLYTDLLNKKEFTEYFSTYPALRKPKK